MWQPRPPVSTRSISALFVLTRQLDGRGVSGDAGGYDGIAINTGMPVSNFNPMAIEDGTEFSYRQIL